MSGAGEVKERERTAREQAPYATETLCARILERHRDRISVQKDHLAVAKLALIIEAVLRLSNRQSFHEMTLRDLAKASGLSMGGLYSYFDNKITLLGMILTEVSETAERVLSDPPAGLAQAPQAHLRWLIETHLRLTEALQPWFVFAYMEAKSFPAPARKIAVDSELATEKIFADVIRRGCDAGVFRVEDVELAAALIKPLLQDWYVKRGKYRKRGVGLERYVETVIAFVDRAIAAPQGAEKAEGRAG